MLNSMFIAANSLNQSIHCRHHISKGSSQCFKLNYYFFILFLSTSFIEPSQVHWLMSTTTIRIISGMTLAF